MTLLTAAAVCQGALTFAPKVPIATLPYNYFDLIAEDLDGDSDIDILLPGINPPPATNMYWFRNLGGGVLSSIIVFDVLPNAATGILVCDLNSDGIKDVAVASFTGGVWWYRGTGGGVFTPRVHIFGGDTAIALAAGDVTGDGLTDLVFAANVRLGYFRNVGGGLFPNGTRVVVGTTGSTCVAVADLDADGDNDIAAGLSMNQVVVHRNNGTGGFKPKLVVANCVNVVSIFTLRMDADSAVDLLFFCYADSDAVWVRNNGSGFFPGGDIFVFTAGYYRDISAGDLDGDGDPDVVTAAYDDSAAFWYRNNGAGQFPEGRIVVSEGLVPVSVAFRADMDNDGRQDVIALTLFEMYWMQSLPHGQAHATSAIWESMYQTTVAQRIPVSPRDSSNHTGAPCDVTAVVNGPVRSNLVGQFVNQVNSSAGYVLPFVLAEPGEYTMRILVDGDDTGLDVEFSAYAIPVPAVCGGDAVSINGSCTACLPGSLKGFADSGAAACVCAPGFWLPNANASIVSSVAELLPQCVACPVGAVCAGGSAAPVAAPGFFPEDGVFIACPYPKACLGAGRCARGYTGRLCAACAKGWYSLNGRCYVCNRAQIGLIALALVLAGLTVCFLLVRFNLGDHRHRFVAAMIALQALQISAMFGRLELDWGPIAKAYFNALGVVNIDWQLTSPECSISRSLDAWTLMWIMTVLLPVLAAIAIAAAALVMLLVARRWGGWTSGQVLDSGRRSWVQAMTLLYLPLISTSYALFGCRRDVAGKWILIARPSRLCYDRQWWALFGPALFFSILYSIVLPGLLFFGLRRLRASISAIQFVLRYGFLVGRFGDRFWFFEALNMATKLGIVVCITFFRSDAGRASAGVFALVLGAGAVIRMAPYRTDFHNWMAVIATSSTACVLFGGTVAAPTLRQVFVLGGISVTILVLTAGNAIDIYIVAAAERVAEGFFKAAQVVEVQDDVPMDDADALRLFGDKGVVKQGLMEDSGGGGGGGGDGKRHGMLVVPVSGAGQQHVSPFNSANAGNQDSSGRDSRVLLSQGLHTIGSGASPSGSSDSSSYTSGS